MDTASTQPAPQAPKGSRIYAIGDVHGRLDLLDRLLNSIAKDVETVPKSIKRFVMVVLGDCIDRGPHSKGVIERLAHLHDEKPFKRFEVHCLMGNHEHIMEAFLEGHNDGELWLNNGGAATLESYGVPDPWADPQQVRADALEHMPKSHRKFLRQLKYQHREGDFVFVHAGVRPDIALDQQRHHDLMWIRSEFLQSEADFGAVVVHGHSPVQVPDVRHNRIAIDTRAWASGTLTCLVVENQHYKFIST